MLSAIEWVKGPMLNMCRYLWRSVSMMDASLPQTHDWRVVQSDLMKNLEKNSYNNFEWIGKAKEMKVSKEDWENKSKIGKQSLSWSGGF